MNVEEARIYVKETLGEDWLLASVNAQLVAGPSLGSPTEQRVAVLIDYHGPGRSEEDHFTVGPHLTFQGEADTIERAIAVAVGHAERYNYPIPTGNIRAASGLR